MPSPTHPPDAAPDSTPASYRPAAWQLARRRLDFPRRPLVMGILNVTPDSFSDGGRFADTAQAVERGLQLESEGADILDVGGESTRPYSQPVDPATELARVRPVIEALAPRLRIPISIDTSKASVAGAACDAGAEIINDVTAMTGDPHMSDAVRRSGAGVCLMHMQGTPQTMQDNPLYTDVVAEVLAYLAGRLCQALDLGIDRERIVVDPGIGFGKSHEHNLALVAQASRFHTLGCPVLVGHSRKGFLARLCGDRSPDRTAATIGIALALARQGVQIVRVHDVGQVRVALDAFASGGGLASHDNDGGG